MSASTLTVKLTAISDLIRLPRQHGTLLLLWPTMWSLVMASEGRPGVKHVVIFTLGTFLMRSAGCAINDIADRNFDGFVERTKARPLASGRLNVGEALAVFATLSLCAFVLVLFLNTLTVILSFAGIILASAYPFVKRVSHLPQAVLGMAFGWGAVMAWSAATGTVGAAAVLIFFANVFWSMAYDTVYALMDMEDDLKIGVKSTAILFGPRVYAMLVVFYVAMAVLLAAAGLAQGMGVVYYAGVASALAAFLVIVASVKNNPTRAAAFRGFVANAAVGAVLLAAVLIDFNL